MLLKSDQLAGSLKRGLAPIYLVAGEEPLLLLECCDQIRAAAKTQGFMNVNFSMLNLVLTGRSYAMLQHPRYSLPRK